MTFYCNDKAVPGKTCPHCSRTLVVITRKNHGHEQLPERYRQFLACPMYSEGCNHTEPLTDEIRQQLDSALPVAVDLGI